MTIKSTVELVERFRAEHGGSDRKAAPILGVSQQVFSLWRAGEVMPPDERVEQMAKATGANIEHALAIAQRDRAKSESVRRAWSRIAEGLAGLVLVSASVLGAPEARADLTKSARIADSIHIVRRRKNRATFADALGAAA